MANITRVLFIGNSFTARNDLPGLLAQLVHAGGKGELESELISGGGASLRMHLNKGEAHEHLQASGWDYVVLQEQSTLPVKNPKRTGENIREFDAVIKAAQAQTVLYMTWARQNAPETQAALSETYAEVGREIGATVVPVGLAWRDCLESHPDYRPPRQGPKPSQPRRVLPSGLHILRDALYWSLQIHSQHRH